MGGSRGPVEPTPKRDIGPYADAPQALVQFGAQTWGMGQHLSTAELCDIVLKEAAMMTGVRPSLFEQEYVSRYMEMHNDPVFSTILAAWIVRAKMAE